MLGFHTRNILAILAFTAAALCLKTETACAASYTWVGGDIFGAGPNAWSNGNNWNPVGIPGTGAPGADDVIITGAINCNIDVPVNLASLDIQATYTGQVIQMCDWTQTLVVSGAVNIAGTNAAGALTHGQNTTTAAPRYALRIHAGSLTIAAGSSLNVSSKGYSSAYQGTGAAPSYYNGAGYGGQGAVYTGTGSFGGNTYGDVFNPTDFGSSGNTPHAAGGSVFLTIDGALALNGTILASATQDGNSTAGASGGTINITAGSISGAATGLLEVKGGNGYSNGGGGGGRIAVALTTPGQTFAGYAGNMVACGVKPGNGQLGAAGTIYIETGDQHAQFLGDGLRRGVLKLDNNNDQITGADPGVQNRPTHVTLLPASFPANGLLNLSKVIVQNRARLGVPAGVKVDCTNLSNFTFDVNGAARSYIFIYDSSSALLPAGTVTISKYTLLVNFPVVHSGDFVIASDGAFGAIPDYSGASQQLSLTLTNGGNLTIQSGGILTADYAGYINTVGSYGPGHAATGNSGSGYGGQGGQPTAADPIGPVYGSVTNPAAYGSSGDGFGGGWITLNIGGSTTVNGLISANGHGGNHGASGGTINITTGSLLGAATGKIEAKGADGYSGGAGGGGGRIALKLTGAGDFSGYPGTLNTAGGHKGNESGIHADGAGGTIYTETAAQAGGFGILTAYNSTKVNEFLGAQIVYTDIISSLTDTVVGKLYTKEVARFRVSPGATLTAKGDPGTASCTGLTTEAATTFDVLDGATLSLGGNAFSVAGPVTLSANSKVVFTGQNGQPAVTLFNPAANTFGKVEFNNANNTFKLSAPTAVATDLTITSGTLDANAKALTVAGTANIAANGTLMANGTLSGAVTVNGKIGADSGTLNLGAPPTLNANAAIRARPAGATCGTLAITGALPLGNALANGIWLDIDPTSVFTAGQTYTFATATGGITGQFCGITGDHLGWNVDYSVVNQLRLIQDNVAPTLTITAAPYLSGDPFISLTAHFSEPVAGFDQSDLVITNGTLAAFTQVTQQDFTFHATPTTIAGVFIDVGVHSFQDLAQNWNAAAVLWTQKGVPPIVWPDPADIVWPNPLAAAQLNATCIVPGTFTYDPPLGTVLSPGTAQELSATYTPDDTDEYATLTIKAHIDILAIAFPTTPTVNPDPAIVAQPATLSALALHPQGDPLSYSWDFGDGASASGQVVTHAYAASGSYNAVVTASDSTGGHSSYVLPVSVVKTVPKITWSDPADLVSPASLTGVQLNASCNVPGTLTYTPPLGTILAPGLHQALSVGFVPDDPKKFGETSSTVYVNVLAITFPSAPVVWPTPVAVNQPVSIACSAVHPQGKPLTYTWDFGDGTTGTGSSVLHVYTAPGVYHATLTASDPTGGWSAISVDIAVQIPLAGGTIDTDGDGYPDDMEYQLGTSPYDPSTYPAGAAVVAGGAAASPYAVKMARPYVKVRHNKNRLIVTGTLPVTGPLAIAGRQLTCYAGGISANFSIDAKGRAKIDENGVRKQFSIRTRQSVRQSNVRFRAIFSSFSKQADLNVVQDPVGMTRVIILFNNTFFDTMANLK